MRTLQILFTSDMHGFCLATDFRDKLEKPMGLSCMVGRFNRDENTLLIDGGDTLQGSPMTYFTSGHKVPFPANQVMNAAGYDYITLGNHDFNFGREILQDYLAGLDAKCLCGNVVDARGEMPIKDSDIRVMPNGLRVGIIGATTSFIPVWEKPEHLIDIEILDPMETMKKAVTAMRSQCDILVGIYHGGFERDLETDELLTESKENIACALCKELDLDILLTGHQHIALGGVLYAGTHMVQTPANAKSFVRIMIRVDDEGEKQITSSLVEADGPADDKITEILAPLNKDVQAWLDAPVGHLEHALMPEKHIKMAVEGSGIADFFNQVQLEATGAQISCVSLANDVKGFNKDVTVRDVVSTYVYPNTLNVLRVNGAQLKTALERAAAYFAYDDKGKLCVSDAFLRPKVEHYNYDFFYGIGYSFDVSKPVGMRVARMMYQGNDIKAEDTFTLCMNNYRATGAGGYNVYTDCDTVHQGTRDISELIIAYLEKHGQVKIEKADFKIIG